MYKSGADVAALGKGGLEVISGKFVKTLRLETETEPVRLLIAYGWTRCRVSSSRIGLG
jgi:hypothetical protein